MLARHLDQLEALLQCSTPEELARAIASVSRDIGFEHWMYALDLPVVDDRRTQFMLGGYPPPWVEHYFANDYLRVDPVIGHCHARTTPFVWPAQPLRPAGADPHSHAIWRLFNEAADFGLRSGVTIPVHGLGCSWGLVSFSATRQFDPDALRDLVPLLHLLASYIHESGHRFAHGEPLPPPPHLTQRELECLHWAAGGKTSWEIGRLIGVSERTVVFHLQNAARKFGVTARQQAIARAIALGLINP